MSGCPTFVVDAVRRERGGDHGSVGESFVFIENCDYSHRRLLNSVSQVQGSSDRFEQEFENLDVTLRLGQRLSPRIQTMTPYEETMRALVFVERLRDRLGERGHVLRVVDDGQPLGVLVCVDAV